MRTSSSLPTASRRGTWTCRCTPGMASCESTATPPSPTLRRPLAPGPGGRRRARPRRSKARTTPARTTLRRTPPAEGAQAAKCFRGASARSSRERSQTAMWSRRHAGPSIMPHRAGPSIMLRRARSPAVPPRPAVSPSLLPGRSAGRADGPDRLMMLPKLGSRSSNSPALLSTCGGSPRPPPSSPSPAPEKRRRPWTQGRWRLATAVLRRSFGMCFTRHQTLLGQGATTMTPPTPPTRYPR
mmetsp:Transcript_37561/g.85527  ORF Transcript_37561/g.85527 Transcript_37561/m.85527 type:complete len:241 (+) Transcript_37561:1245-1967(+)